MPTPVPDLIYGALAEIRVARGGDVVRAEDQALCLTFLNEILERLAVTPHALYARLILGFFLTPGTTLQTIGPTPTSTIVVPRRPVRIVRASVQPGDGTLIPVPLQSEAWSLEHRLPALAGPIPTGLWYNPTWPDGALYVWPMPTQAILMGLETDVEIRAVADTDTLDLPQGYAELLRLWTAKKAAPSFARAFSAESQAALTECLGEIFGTNIPRVNDLDTRDGGVPGGRGGGYDYRTGLVS